MENHSTEALQCTALQVAHHMFNPLHRLYSIIKPDIALVPTMIIHAIEAETDPCVEAFRLISKIVPLQNQYYASAATDVFDVKAGRVVLTDRLPIIGGIYDGSLV